MTKNALNKYFEEENKRQSSNQITIANKNSLLDYLINFQFEEKHFSSKTLIETQTISDVNVTRFINEFWTSKQRKGSSIHEISYRACFKPQLAKFFIDLFTRKGDIVYDPFSGRGTTVLEAGRLGRNIIQNDINPLSKIIIYPRFFIPKLEDIKVRLSEIGFEDKFETDIDLSMFYDKKTLSEIISIKNYINNKEQDGNLDPIDSWIRMIATNRLTGHSPGFFSVYTLPPNQAVSAASQLKINQKRNQFPEYRDTKKLILHKSKSLLKNISEKEVRNLKSAGEKGIFITKDAQNIPEIIDESVSLTVTSPPFLDIVQYAKDNWLRCWFNSIDVSIVEKQITMAKNITDWSDSMKNVFQELFRVTKYGGWVAFEVGEIRKGKTNLEESIVPLGLETGFDLSGILVNSQKFTKTANIWGISNNKSGTNSNRIVMFQKNN
jgi:DNA modification methylase